MEGVPAFTNTAGAFSRSAPRYRACGDSRAIDRLPSTQFRNSIPSRIPRREYGWRPGSVVNVGIKSGTNTMHGSAYSFGRDAAATDAANPFNPGQGATPALVEQFGATAGGPIVKDKLFWFFGLRGPAHLSKRPLREFNPRGHAAEPDGRYAQHGGRLQHSYEHRRQSCWGHFYWLPLQHRDKGPNGVVNPLSALLAGLPGR